LLENTFDRSCGPSGCQIQWLSSPKVEVDLDVVAFTEHAMGQGWGDGLPLIPPTEERVREYVAHSGRFPDEVLAELPPRRGRCTVEKLAINAVMAGAPSSSMPLLCSTVEALANPDFNLGALNATTGSVVPMMLVHGPQRNEIPIPYGPSCFGGVAGPAPAIGRTMRLIMRNVAGQVSGVTSQSVFGQPGRVAGIVVGEWEERSPWAPLGERRGVVGNAVSIYGAMGTTNVCDVVADSGQLLLETFGKAMAMSGANGFLTSMPYSEGFIAFNPMHAEMIGSDIPDIAEVQALLWEHSSHPVDRWAPQYRPVFDAAGRIDAKGRIHMTPSPNEIVVMVCGGTGNLHGYVVHSWGETVMTTRAVMGAGVEPDSAPAPALL
jgi:hypothetical protein